MNSYNLKNKKILAIIPARSGSKSLKNKNIKPFCKKPLLHWVIKAANQSKFIHKTIVSTDSLKIKKICQPYNVEVPFLRPKRISQDNSRSVDLIFHVINYFKNKEQVFDYVILLEPTSPLTTAEDIDEALVRLHKNRKYADAIVGISQNINRHPIYNVKVKPNGTIRPYKKKFFTLRRQNLEKLYFFDGSLYISKIDKLIKSKTFYHNRTLGFITQKWKSIEVDDIADFIIAETIFKNRKKLEKFL